jgi:TusA-related sulfurtransferase
MTTEAVGLPAMRAIGDGHSRDPAREAAERLVGAIVARDYGRIFDVLARDARFRYLIPSGPGQVVGAADVAATFFEWFGDAVELEVQETLVERVSDRISARYRFLFRKDADWKLAEQQAYLNVDPDGRIVAIDLVCSGFRTIKATADASAPGEHEFDAGAMSCADGLAPEFRRRIRAIPVGDVLVVTARDPAAKEDLPPLARLMGHTVRSVEEPGDGRLVVTVERGR